LKYRSQILNYLKLFQKSIPSTSVIAQPPADSVLVLAEILLSNHENSVVNYRVYEGINYTILEYNGNREIYAGGISSFTLNDKTDIQIEKSYQLLSEILLSESMRFNDIVRQWNYIEEILRIDTYEGEEVQNYQSLNNVRSRYYERCEFPNGFPAATGIGMNAGGIILEIYALSGDSRHRIVPLRNPLQTDAYNYSEKLMVGRERSTPKFERAKYVERDFMRTIFISGTASIQNEETVGNGDIVQQTTLTVQNIKSLIGLVNLTNSVKGLDITSVGIEFLRVYIKKGVDYSRVQEVVRQQFGDIETVYLIADICRSNLMVEIEGIASVH
jgi:enamine deaminase RidA (YjgF/YER057c/UK114 family)